jgi:DNA-binding response OmpR family regulator
MRILVIEDEPKLADVVKGALEELGHAVDTADDGDLGLAFAETAPYDLIVLDVMLPKLDGYTLCRALRAEHNDVPVLMLTARDTVNERVTGLDCGADDYLVKPFALPELLARVRALLRRDRDGHSKDPVLRVADVELDTVAHAVRRGGRAIELSTREYAMLEYFMRNPNRVLTRTQLADHLWDYNFVSVSNVVDVYVGYLRRKLGDDREPRLLRTIRGTGYQLRGS